MCTAASCQGLELKVCLSPQIPLALSASNAEPLLFFNTCYTVHDTELFLRLVILMVSPPDLLSLISSRPPTPCHSSFAIMPVPSMSCDLCLCTSCPLGLSAHSSLPTHPVQPNSGVTLPGELPLQSLQRESEASSSVFPQLFPLNLHFNTNHGWLFPCLCGLDIKARGWVHSFSYPHILAHHRECKT